MAVKNSNNKKKKTNTKKTKAVNKEQKSKSKISNTTIIKKEEIEKKLNKKPKSVKKKEVKVKDFLLESNKYKEAEKLFKEKKYNEAYIEYLKVLEDTKDKRVYKRLIETFTKDYTYKEKNKEFNGLLKEYITSYELLCNNREKKYLEKKLDLYKNVEPVKSKSRFVLIFLLGFLGVHKFIEKKYVLGLIYLFTLGIFGIGVLIDLINDYAEYEDYIQLDIVRYIISIGLIVLALFNINNSNYYFLIIAGILFMPIVFSKILHLIPNIIKVIALIILIYSGLKVVPVIDSVPIKLIGNWETNNENTNFISIKIKNDKSTIKFNDRDKEIGINEYDSETKILEVYINATKYYKFKLDKEGKNLCIYNDSNTCNVAFTKKK